MKDSWYRRTAWVMAFMALAMLSVSAVMLFFSPDRFSDNWLESQIRSIVTLGAPLLGLIIVVRQPRQRIGWLWIIYGLAVGLRTLGHAIYFYGGSQASGYSDFEYFLIWSTEAATYAGFSCLSLLMLWFPDGRLLSRRWRVLYAWLLLAFIMAARAWFEVGSHWNGPESGGVVIENPYGWLAADTSSFYPFVSFLSIVLIMILSAVSVIFRYRSSGKLVRSQIRWFVLGGVLTVTLSFIPVFTLLETGMAPVVELLLKVVGFMAIVPLYLAVGVAILRYRLYDFDLIIRKTLVYALLTGLLALLYFGMIILLQSVFDLASGQQSPIAIVISTLVIAALFAPLRRRVQAVIDRRFFRKKYDAQQVLAQFAQTARDETDMDVLTAELLRVIQETMQPEQSSLWLKENPQ